VAVLVDAAGPEDDVAVGMGWADEVECGAELFDVAAPP